MSENMCPFLAPLDVTYVGLVNRELIRDLPLKNADVTEPSDFPHVTLRQLSRVVGDPARSATAPLDDPIPDVARVGPRPQVVGIDAGRVVTTMSDAHAFRKSSLKMQYEAVRVDLLAAIAGLSIACWVPAERPLPTTFRRLDCLFKHPVKKLLAVHPVFSRLASAAHEVFRGLSRGLGSAIPRGHSLHYIGGVA